MRETYASVPPARKLRDATFTTLTLGTWVDGSIPIRSGSSVAAPALSAQGSFYAWDTTATAGFKDTARAWNCLATNVVGFYLANTTLSTDANRVQYSPILALGGRAYRHTAGAEDQAWDWGMQVRPVAGSSAATTSALHLLSRSYIGGVWSTFTSRMNINSSGVLTTDGYTTGSINIFGSLTYTGLATNPSDTVYGLTALRTLSLLQINRTDGANNVVVQTVYDPSADSITNAATMRLHSFAWIKNTGRVNTEVAAIYCNGSYVSSFARNLSTTCTPGISLANTTAATAGIPVQYSPSIELIGYGWMTGASTAAGWRLCNRPSGTANSSKLHFTASLAGGAFFEVMDISSDGVLSLAAGTTGSFFGTQADGVSSVGVRLGSDLPYVTAGAKLLSVVNSSSSSNETLYDSYRGALGIAGATAAGVFHGYKLEWTPFDEEITIATTGTDHPAIGEGIIPADSIVIFCSSKVTSASANAVTYGVGITGTTGQYGSSLSLNTTATKSKGLLAGAIYYSGATTLRITTSGDAGAGGKVRIAGFYYTVTEPTS